MAKKKNKKINLKNKSSITEVNAENEVLKKNNPFNNFQFYNTDENKINNIKPFNNFILTSILQKEKRSVLKEKPLSLNDLETSSKEEFVATVEDNRLSLDDLEINPEEEFDDLSDEELDEALDDNLTPSLEEDRLTLDDVDVHPEEEEIEVSDGKIDKALDDNLTPSLEKDRLTLDDVDVHPEEEQVELSVKEIKDLEQNELLSQNLYSYEDDGDEIDKFKEMSDFSWPTGEGEESNDGKTKQNILENEREELKEILLYLDQLFGNLPEIVIKDFVRSQYYERYNNLLDKLEI